MKHLKLFFALFAMLALGVGNAWGAENVTITKTTNTLVSELGWSVSSGNTCAGCYTEFQLDEAITISTTGTPNCGSIWGTPTNDWRLYQTQNGNVIVSAKEGYELVSITLTYSTSKSGTLKDGSTTISSNAVVSCSGLKTKTLTVGNTSTNTNGQVRITTFSVTYVQTAGSGSSPVIPAELPAPANLKEASIAETSATLSWDAVANASNYSVTINGNTETVTTTSYSATGLTAGTEYTWSVVAKGDGTNYTDSEAAQHTFTTASPTPDPEPGTGTNVTYDFTKIEGFKDWPTSYASGKGDVVYTEATVKFTGAVKQTQTITDCPVTKGGEVQLVLNSGYSNRDITNVTFVCRQWGTKSQTITLHYSTDGGVNYTNTEITSTNFTISSDNLPEGTNAVKITFSSTSNQVGIESVTFSLSSDDEPGSGETVPSLTQEEFSWSATTATATLPDQFDPKPTLKNTKGLDVTYSTSNDKVATIDEDGNVKLEGVGTADIKATAGDDITFKKTTVSYTLTVNKAPATPTDNVYVKVTTTAGITDGEYLIVYEDASNTTPAPVAFDGSLTNLDAASNNIAVTISSNTIAGNTDIDAATFTIDATAKTIKSASGQYIGRTAYDNGLDSKIEVLTNTIEISEGNAVITASGNCVLRYNSASGQYRFRYYKSGQQPIALYKKASKHTVTIADCTNGSVSASVANGAQVLSGTTITLTPNAKTGYKLSAYDVYKTSDKTTKVTVDGNTFIMPEFDVTISATFEQLKELDRIEVNTTNVKTTFWQGETFNSTGLVVTAYYTDETSTTVTPNSITGSTAEAGTKQVTVSYTEGDITKETEYDITVKAIANNEETPYTVIEAREIIDAVGETTIDVYVQGIVSKIVTAYNSEYGNISYNISEDGKTTSAQLQAYRGKSYNGEEFTSADDIQVDDKVVVKGKLKKHETTYEFAQDNQLVSLVRSTEPKPTAATLPFEFDGNKDDIADVVGMSQTGLGTYDLSPKLKFDTENDNVIIHFDSEPGEFSFLLKQNGSNAGTFTVYESENGEDYTSIWSGGDLGGTGKSATIKPTISATSRYVKFEYTTKPSGTNYGLGSISIAKPDLRQEAGIAWSAESTTITIGDAFTAPTLSNPKGLTLSCTSDNEDLATVTNTGAITLKEGVTGKAVITAKFAGNEDYKSAEVTTTIIVSPETGDVVILAKHQGQWYAMKAEYVTDKTDRLAAVAVNYVGGKLYNVSEEDKAAITWTRSVYGDKVSFQNEGKYLKGKTSTTLILEANEEGLYQWNADDNTMLIGETSRTFIYHKDGMFRNYDVQWASPTSETYSDLPVVTAPVYATGDAYSRSTTAGKFGTICLPFGSTNFTGAEFFECVGKEEGKVYLGSVTTLVAGTPYIFLASATEVAVYGDGTTAATPGSKNGLVGTFTNDTEVAANDDNHILLNNELRKVAETCWVNAYRAYIVMSEVPTEPVQQMPGRRYIGMSVQGENEATGFENITAPAGKTVKAIVNGQLIIIRDGEMYNAQGQRL